MRDVTAGTNDLNNVGCCTARPGHDTASGWGSVDFGAVADYLTITVTAAPSPAGVRSTRRDQKARTGRTAQIALAISSPCHPALKATTSTSVGPLWDWKAPRIVAAYLK